MDRLKVGDLVHINCYGVLYDGVVSSITDDEIVLEEARGNSKLLKIILRKQIAAITMRATC